jgi:hypothetical protein
LKLAKNRPSITNSWICHCMYLVIWSSPFRDNLALWCHHNECCTGFWTFVWQCYLIAVFGLGIWSWGVWQYGECGA